MRTSTILGLDFGERRIGVALSDTGKSLASGLTTIDCRKRPDYIEAIAEIVRDESVEAIVVGYPLRTDGTSPPGSKTEAVDAFIAALEARFGLPVHREDESHTSQMAKDSLRARGGGRKSRRKGGWAQAKAEIDRVAACYILQDYLDHADLGRSGGAPR
jgi:putative Holliday junction resolvase